MKISIPLWKHFLRGFREDIIQNLYTESDQHYIHEITSSSAFSKDITEDSVFKLSKTQWLHLQYGIL